MATRMQQRRGTAATWTAADPILAAGEIGFEIDTNKFKIGDGSNRWANLTYFTADAAAAIEDLIDGAPGLLDTLNELAAAINDDPNFFATVATNLSNHEADTTNVHGIANTAELATKTFAAELLTNATKTNIVITGDKNGLTITAENGVADSDTDDLAEGTTNKYFTDERAQDAIGNNLGTGLSYNDSTGSISVTANTYDAYGSASTAQSNAETFATNAINALDTDDIEEGSTNQYFTSQRALLATAAAYDAAGSADAVASDLSDHELDTTTHGVSGNIVGTSDTQTLTNKTITSADNSLTIALSDIDGVTANLTEINLLDGLTATTTELNYVDGVTSSIQTQLDSKANLSGAIFTGGVEVDGTLEISDLTESTSAVSGSVVTAGGLGVGGNVYIGGDLDITGDFIVHGTSTTISTQDLVVQDPLIYVGEDNPGNVLDLGIVASFDDGTYQHTGLVRDSSAGTWKLFKGVTDEPTTTINFAQGSLDDLAVGGLTATSLTVGDVSNTEIGYLNGVTSAIQTQIDGKISASSTDTLTNKSIDLSTNTLAGTKAQFNLAMSDADFATLDGTETLTNKTVSYTNNTITVQVGNVSDLTATAVELNTLDGITASTAELNVLDGVTASTSELNVLDGITASTAELNILDGVTTTTTELNYVDGVTSSIQTQLNSKAPLASPALTGTPTAPTATAGTNSTQIATTAFVDAAIEALGSRSLVLDGGGV